jgi:nucleoid-associated protein YgaU
MGFEKATIQRYDPKTFSAEGDRIDVLFNPTEYRLSKSNQFAEVAIPGLKAPLLQFSRGNAHVLSMQLFFDTYEQGTDVRAFTSQITGLLKIDPKLHAPPVCVFCWGKLQFVGVLERAEQRFTLFLSNGVPVRATVDISLKEFCLGEEREAVKLESANYAKRYVVRRGDTLSGIAGREYGDPALWRPIAEENAIDDPLALQPGQVVVIPAIE